MLPSDGVHVGVAQERECSSPEGARDDVAVPELAGGRVRSAGDLSALLTHNLLTAMRCGGPEGMRAC